MRPRLTALLAHGLGQEAAWWAPLCPALADLGVTPVPLALPSLETAGPEAWVDELATRSADGPTLLIGHSLGAAAAIRAARRAPVEGVILMAWPLLDDLFIPNFPPRSGLSSHAAARIGIFLRQATIDAASLRGEVVHFVGDQDTFIPLEQARRMPFPVLVVPGAGHELNRVPAFARQLAAQVAESAAGRRLLDPGDRYLAATGRWTCPAETVGDNDTAPPPARLDIEITTRCQLRCRRCIRTLEHGAGPAAEMDRDLFRRTLDGVGSVREAIFVGLGEPLLHPDIEFFVGELASRGIQAHLVTNGLLAGPQRLAGLQRCGLGKVTFSIDSADPGRFAFLRGGASFEVVAGNFRNVPDGLTKSIFATLSRHNAADLPGLVDLVAEAGLPALALSDVNFEANQAESLHAGDSGEWLMQGVRYARDRGVVLVGPHFHDFRDVMAAMKHCIVRKPEDLAGRSATHRHCLSPWRIAVVDAAGRVTPCNCAPDVVVGTLKEEAFDVGWNGPRLRAWRQAMSRGGSALCKSCPRY